jgi:hypothetical protein
MILAKTKYNTTTTYSLPKAKINEIEKRKRRKKNSHITNNCRATQIRQTLIPKPPQAALFSDPWWQTIPQNYTLNKER